MTLDYLACQAGLPDREGSSDCTPESIAAGSRQQYPAPAQQAGGVQQQDADTGPTPQQASGTGTPELEGKPGPSHEEQQ